MTLKKEDKMKIKKRRKITFGVENQFKGKYKVLYITPSISYVADNQAIEFGIFVHEFYFQWLNLMFYFHVTVKEKRRIFT